MPAHRAQLEGQTFGKLTAHSFAGIRRKRTLWRCVCECGNEKFVVHNNLVDGSTTSCGCHKRQLLQERGRFAQGPLHPHWKGGRSIHDGYVSIWVDGIGVIREHIYIMIQHLGRNLFTDESVHHKNGIRDDNRFENLELRTRYHGAGQTIPDQIVWATEILRRYDPERLSCS